MTAAAHRTGLSWSARLLIGLVLIILGAAAATWGLAHYQQAARFVGVVPANGTAQPTNLVSKGPAPQPPLPVQQPELAQQKIAVLEQRVAQLESATQHIEGSAGRSDALVIAFAARRAIERGQALGYLEPLLIDRFANQHQRAVATVITAAHQPVPLEDLINGYERLGPELRRGGPEDSWWSNLRRELGSVIEVHRADRPAASLDSRFERARRQLAAGDVDNALAETMRMPGAQQAQSWIGQARRYIATQRALDELESAALLTRPAPAAQ